MKKIKVNDKNYPDPYEGIISIENLDPYETLIQKSAIPKQTKAELKKQIDATPDDEIPDFNVSRARKEHWQASLAKLQVEQQKKELIPVSDIKKSSFELGRAIRESLSNVADRLAPQCAGETDSQVIHQLLMEEHRNALEELAKI